ncbi:ATP-dependent DNA ligase [Bacillus phage PK-3]|nr:ATP-dependent DNA ligase [Bacillus phage PK-3]
MSVQKLFESISELMNQTTKSGKESTLEKYKGDELFRFTLDFLLNSRVLTRISTKKINKKIESFDLALFNHDFDDIADLMRYLKSQSSGKDYDIYIAQNFINKQETEELRDFVTKIITKTLKLGVSEKTVNKVYGKGTIPEFKVMLAESFEKKHDKVEGEFYITLKLDGNRCVAIVDGNGVKFFTRQGKPILDMVELESQFNSFPQGVYDGELLLINKDSIPSDELFRATQKTVRKDGEKRNLEFHIFDFISISEFEDGISKRTYEQRRNTLNMVIAPYTQNEGSMINVLPVLYSGNDKSVIPTLMKEVEDKGFEGLMINTAKGLYQTKRTSDLLKVKTMKTADLLVMSVEKAIDGQFEGLLGRVNVEYKGNLVGVGSGFTIEQRREFIDNPDLICGKIIEVQFFEESKDEKTGMPSLRFPVFKGIRDDKTVEDINYGE